MLAHYGLKVLERRKLFVGRSRELYIQNEVALDSFQVSAGHPLGLC